MSKKRWILIILALLIGITAACFILPKKIGSDCQKEIEECRDYVEENELKCICPTDCKEYENGNPFCGEDNNTINEVIENEIVEDKSSLSDNCKKEQEKCFELQRNGYDIMCDICPGDYGVFTEEEISIEDDSSASDNCKKEQEECFELQRNGYNIACDICL